jgi:hypothetical protein
MKSLPLLFSVFPLGFREIQSSEAEALKSERRGKCVDVGFGRELEKISGFMFCDGWWLSLCAKVVACEAAYTYILSPSPKSALSRRFESFSPINAVPYDEAVIEDTLSRCGRSDDSCCSP